MDIEYYVVKTEIANVVFNERQESNPCSLCAKMRKGALNDFCQKYWLQQDCVCSP